MRTISTDGTGAITSSASSTSRSVGAPKLVPRSNTAADRLDDRRMTGGPRIIGPQDPT